MNETRTMFENIQNPFQSLSSEYLRFKELQKYSYLIKPQTCEIGSKKDVKVLSNKRTLQDISITIQVVPLREVLKQLFELPDFYSTVLTYVNSLNKMCDKIKNIIQSPLWKSKVAKYKASDTVLPILLYYDDYEVCNPLGAHAGAYKIGGVYVSLSFLPSELRSKLDNILLFSLFHSDDRKAYGNKAIFHYAVSELHFLETTGIDICISKQTVKLYFVLALVVGDNLGLNSLLGYVECFNANYCCRFCMSSKHDIEHSISLKLDNLRDINY